MLLSFVMREEEVGKETVEEEDFFDDDVVVLVAVDNFEPRRRDILQLFAVASAVSVEGNVRLLI
jgi:hypothetical protein